MSSIQAGRNVIVNTQSIKNDQWKTAIIAYYTNNLTPKEAPKGSTTPRSDRMSVKGLTAKADQKIQEFVEMLKREGVIQPTEGQQVKDFINNKAISKKDDQDPPNADSPRVKKFLQKIIKKSVKTSEQKNDKYLALDLDKERCSCFSRFADAWPDFTVIINEAVNLSQIIPELKPLQEHIEAFLNPVESDDRFNNLIKFYNYCLTEKNLPKFLKQAIDQRGVNKTSDLSVFFYKWSKTLLQIRQNILSYPASTPAKELVAYPKKFDQSKIAQPIPIELWKAFSRAGNISGKEVYTTQKNPKSLQQSAIEIRDHFRALFPFVKDREAFLSLFPLVKEKIFDKPFGVVKEGEKKPPKAKVEARRGELYEKIVKDFCEAIFDKLEQSCAEKSSLVTHYFERKFDMIFFEKSAANVNDLGFQMEKFLTKFANKIEVPPPPAKVEPKLETVDAKKAQVSPPLETDAAAKAKASPSPLVDNATKMQGDNKEENKTQNPPKDEVKKPEEKGFFSWIKQGFSTIGSYFKRFWNWIFRIKTPDQV